MSFVLVDRERRMALARALYCDTTTPIKAIAAQVQVGETTIRAWKCREGWPARSYRLALEIGEGRWIGKTCPGLAFCPERKIEVARAWSMASEQIEEIGKRQTVLAGQGTEQAAEGVERLAKAFALVVRTMRELAAIEEGKSEGAKSAPRRGPAKRGTAGGKAGAAADGSGDDQTFLGDVDGLRQAIARQLDGLRRGGTAAAIPGTGPAGESAAPET